MESDVKTKKYCRMCGKAHKAKYNYCKRCGINLDDAGIDEIYQSSKSDIYFYIGFSICLYVLFGSCENMRILFVHVKSLLILSVAFNN